ncbi:ATP-binding protein [Winogradskyella undariae]|uniref:ATP-binding protein n=1 Tax=Winogradskyella undariae TaxID=1285465 RepID=UPI00156B3BAA|nr:ATP-binding protein [Winogradskyella undariae]NRR90834.1 ATP-binding protein [Winogradskyella undariae]
MVNKKKHRIKAKSHILSLLGEELIGSDSLAIFELVKNAYDADADKVKVQFIDLNTESQQIIIEDDGHGMSAQTIENVWLTIGTDFKRGKNRKVSNKYNRVSFGNKGVGRLAVHKLAKIIELETQESGQMFSNRLEINWPKLINSKEFIQELEVEVETVANINFEKGQGTRITLSDLTTKNWTKKSFRELVRKIDNIKNPFQESSDFSIEITCNDWHKEWIESIKTPKEILENSLYQFDFNLDLSKKDEKQYPFANFNWSYKFNPHKNINIEKDEKQSEKKNPLLLIGESFKDIDGLDAEGKPLYKKYLQNSDLKGIGNIQGRFYVFNQNRAILEGHFPGQLQAVKNYISDNKGVKIFRDNIRVYNYGESNDDWLNLDYDKIQHAGSHFGKKVTIGVIELDLASSVNGLVEKTNREGLIENITYDKFQIIVKSIFSFFEKNALQDKEKIDEFLEELKPIKKIGFGDTIRELEEKLKEKNLDKELDPLLKKVGKDYNEMRDIMINSGMTGLNLGIAFHEIEREMKYINSDLQTDKINIIEIKDRVSSLLQIMESLSPLLRKNKKSNSTAKTIIEISKRRNDNRFNYHEIVFSSPVLTGELPDFKFKGPTNLIISAVSNLIDNSIYWTTAKRDLKGSTYQPAIFIGTDIATYDAPSIIIADNGNGFSMEPEYLTQAFKTNKEEGGMGLGLYFADLVMKMTGGKLLFPDVADLDLPPAYTGACIVLVFPKNQ